MQTKSDRFFAVVEHIFHGKSDLSACILSSGYSLVW